MESSMDAYTITYVNREPMGICSMTQKTQTASLQQTERWDDEGDGREVGREGTCVYLWLILVDV